MTYRHTKHLILMNAEMYSFPSTGGYPALREYALRSSSIQKLREAINSGKIPDYGGPNRVCQTQTQLLAGSMPGGQCGTGGSGFLQTCDRILTECCGRVSAPPEHNAVAARHRLWVNCLGVGVVMGTSTRFDPLPTL